MADDEKEGEGTLSRGADWEVVSLTASTYAAAPGPKEFDLADENKGKELNKNESESSGALFMSGHFAFPPSEHENLPVELELSEIQSEAVGQENIAEDDSEVNKMNEENVQSKSDNSPLGIQYGMECEEGKGLEKINLIGEEQDIHLAPEFSSFHAETGRSESVPHIESSELYEHSPQNLESPPKYAKKNEEDKSDESGLPCEAWWKRHAASLYRHAKDANTFWSVCVAAALMGLVILGQRWRREKWQLHHLKLRFSINDERMGRMLGPTGRFKDVLVGGHQRSVHNGGASASL